MDIIARARSIRISPRKVRLVADGIRNLPLDKALNVLNMTQKRGASVLNAVFKSAIGNAVNNSKKSLDSLKIKGIEVWDGPAIKKFHPSTRGRVHPYKKRSSHIKIILTDDHPSTSSGEKLMKGAERGTKS
ncbi:MAG: 50S ribosomal protein L22 [Candidatus Levybacteria bacterium GW2011_GWA2_37_36]|nr:MAG: 50S ribosomal protein L22 [Candidatus Levybacteria bacterium GW2011_GWA1_37_16]KKQ33639.1 MAG: 50S ribosomal protein L22 [Candidatus Levybacteria bacterium GW2011_GWA2_37_36]KKQ36707.1 MAG: 50S ribosomal protein L22 [Candidatus Levybacteria bacterium GW2011_GWC2_37_7]KKQ41936.1 MAG: 50S ribosomal protein L22 [Candidatus Levybacteria bacterium GW2011_GWB1_37_8]OGH51367.1 MAG: 50S ribosomal protein L22 [Candidatus Levybacteria bacterium RIFCSPLOWO2_12_FULL_37_14]